MTHDEVAVHETIDRYVRSELPAAEREAFESHLFECDICFADVEEHTRLRDVVRFAGRQGWLDGTNTHSGMWTWLVFAAAVALLAGAGWITFLQMPRLYREIATLRAERDSLSARLAATPTGAAASAEPAVALVNLEANRTGTGVASVAVPRDASRIVLAVPAAHAVDGARLLITRASAETAVDLANLYPSSDAGYAVSIPASQLPAGRYRVQLFGSSAADAPLLGTYELEVKAGRE